AIFPNLVCQGIGRGFYISGYTLTQEGLEWYQEGFSKHIVGKFVSASVAGISGWLFVFPFDVIRTNMMADLHAERFPSSWSCAKFLYYRGGVSEFYVGLGLVLVRAVPVACAALVSYDLTQEFLLKLIS